MWSMTVVRRLFISLSIWFVLLLLSASPTRAFDEQERFCIRTEPMLLSDIEKHVNPIEDDFSCDIVATTLTIKEKESFLDTMCKDHGVAHKADHHYFKLHNGDLNGFSSYMDICNGKANPLLAWIPYNQMQAHYAHELDPKERLTYIGKATDLERERTALCHFRHSDLIDTLSSELFTCIVMIFEDNFYGLEDNINVLVEIQPLMYEIRNITYLPWRNVTNSYKTMLGKSVLKNTSREKKPIYGSINYAFVEKLQINTSGIYNEKLLKLPLLFEHRNSVLELDDNGIGGLNVTEKAYFGRNMDPKSTVKVDVVGQWAEQYRQFTADIYEYFGYGIRRFRQEIPHATVSIIRIDTTEPVFEAPESDNLATASVYTTDQKSEQIRLQKNDSADDITWEGEDFSDDNTDGHIYPGFYPWFVISALIVGVVLLVAVYGMVRTCSNKNEQKQKYKLTGM